MAAPAGSILPDTYFSGLSQLWGACAFVGSALVAAGFVFAVLPASRDPGRLASLLLRVFSIGVATAFLREWLMRLNDVVSAFGDYLGIDPTDVDDKFIRFISGTTPAEPQVSVWDVIWKTKSIGTALSYALLWLFGWLSWGMYYIVRLVGDVLLSAGWALSPLFLALFMIPPMARVGFRYLIGLVALVCWPFGWAIASVVTNAMLDAAATASLLPVVAPGSGVIAPALTVLLVGCWMLVSSLLAPYITTKILLMGANPIAAFAQGAGGVAQAGLSTGLLAGATAATAGTAAAGVMAAAAAGAVGGATESAARGGGSARTASTAAGGMAGFYGARNVRRQTGAYDRVATAFTRMANAAESMAGDSAERTTFFREANRRMRQQRPERSAQPHTEDPNKTALEIETYARN